MKSLKSVANADAWALSKMENVAGAGESARTVAGRTGQARSWGATVRAARGYARIARSADYIDKGGRAVKKLKVFDLEQPGVMFELEVDDNGLVRKMTKVKDNKS